MSLGDKCLPGPKSGSSKKTGTQRRVNFNCVDMKPDGCELRECFCSLQYIKIALCVHSRTHCKIARSLLSLIISVSKKLTVQFLHPSHS